MFTNILSAILFSVLVLRITDTLGCGKIILDNLGGGFDFSGYNFDESSENVITFWL